MRIPTTTESLSRPKEGEVVFFTDVLLQGIRLPLQPAVQRILAQIGYAPGQFNPNFWVALMGVVTAFGMAGEGAPSYEQFSHLYSVTKLKSAEHGGWCRVNLPEDVEETTGKLKQPSATQAEIWQINKVRLKVPAVERVYSKFLFTANLIKAQLVNSAEMTEERRAAEAKRMNESSKRRLMLGLQGKKKKSRKRYQRPREESTPKTKPLPTVFVSSMLARRRPKRQQSIRLLAEVCLLRAPPPKQLASAIHRRSGCRSRPKVRAVN
ncbi:unnamed protein product [Prunus armeniaca]